MKAAGVLNGNSKIYDYVLSLQDSPDNKQTEQDRRIIRLKSLLRRIMGEEAFKAFYKTTSFNGDILESQLVGQLHALIINAVNKAVTERSDFAGLARILRAIKKGMENS
jgi:chromatin remodeling complex protein RSC6